MYSMNWVLGDVDHLSPKYCSFEPFPLAFCCSRPHRPCCPCLLRKFTVDKSQTNVTNVNMPPSMPMTCETYEKSNTWIVPYSHSPCLALPSLSPVLCHFSILIQVTQYIYQHPGWKVCVCQQPMKFRIHIWNLSLTKAPTVFATT